MCEQLDEVAWKGDGENRRVNVFVSDVSFFIEERLNGDHALDPFFGTRTSYVTRWALAGFLVSYVQRLCDLKSFRHATSLLLAGFGDK